MYDTTLKLTVMFGCSFIISLGLVQINQPEVISYYNEGFNQNFLLGMVVEGG